MFNKVHLMGRICHDLELKSTQSGTAVLSFRIAVDRSYQPKGEERKTDFFNIVAWRSTAEFVSKYFSKGRMIMVDGELQTRQYENKDKVTVNVVEIIADSVHFTGEKSESSQNGNQGQSGVSYGGYTPPPPQGQQPQYTPPPPQGGYAAAQPQTGVYTQPPTQEGGYQPYGDNNGGQYGGSADDDDYPF